MAISKLLTSSFPTLVVALLCSMAAAQSTGLFTEYIGALFNGVKFSDVPVNSAVEFHFILSFAIDYDTSSSSKPTPTDGQFGIFWDSATLSPAAVAAVKQSNPNVKVALSLGGATVSNIPVVFTPTSIDSWVNNAVASLTTIITDYGLDGIDIDYETFPADDDANTFTECIGRLLTELKSKGVISFASIAPFADPEVQRHYLALWDKYASVIDYVNFQFYGYSSSTTVEQFLEYYQEQAANYKGGKVMASFTTASVQASYGGLTPQNGFFDACRTLKNQGMLPGIFVWSADNSLTSSNGFQYEQQAQELLAE